MIKKLYITTILSLLTVAIFSAQHTVSNSGTTFTPAEITIQPGDEVVFNLGSMHNAIEVSFDTYSSNGNTSNGGFSVPFGGGTVSFPTAGTYYYVCEPHAEFGMKGIIHVETISKVNSTTADTRLTVFPNPASEYFSVNYLLQNKGKVEIMLVDIAGNDVLNILNDVQNEGNHSLINNLNSDVAAGIYFVRINTDEGVLTKKLIIK
jgi:plastocyanin